MKLIVVFALLQMRLTGMGIEMDFCTGHHDEEGGAKEEEGDDDNHDEEE